MVLNFEFEILLSTWIGHEKVKEYCESKNHNIKCIPEEKPLGTFGAIANVASKNYAKNYLVIISPNPLTYLLLPLKEFFNF